MGWQNIVVGAQKHDPVYTSTQGTRENNHANTSELAAAASLVGVCEADSVLSGHSRAGSQSTVFACDRKGAVHAPMDPCNGSQHFGRV